GKAVPDRVVVQQLGMPLEVQRRRLARVVIAIRVEREPVARGAARTPVARELGPGAAQREVDVEQDRAHAHQAPSASQRATSTFLAMITPSMEQAVRAL